MKKYRKIRGHKRIWKHIDLWREDLKVLDLNYLRQNQREYVKVWIPPFRNISITNSDFKPPSGKTRKKIVDGIFTIYNHWKIQLEELGQPYYLKIWFYPQDVSKCQVVCAIGEALNFYDNTFYDPGTNKPFPENKRDLNWEYRIQEFHLTEEDIDEPDLFASYEDYLENKNWVESVMRNPRTRISQGENSYGIPVTYYSSKEYDVWIGGN